MTEPIQAVLETCLYVDDLEAAAAFYESVLRLQLHSRQAGRHVFFRCGNQMVLLFVPTASSDPTSALPRHGSHGAGHVAFAVPEEAIPDWQKRLEDHRVSIEKSIRWPAGGTSIYFRDPAGNSIELASPSIWGIGDKA